MNVKVFIIGIVIATLLLGSVVAETLTVEQYPSAFETFINNLKKILNIGKFSVVGDDKSCGTSGGNPNKEWTIQQGQRFNSATYGTANVISVCGSGATGLYDVFTNGWTPYAEYYNGVDVICGTGPCNIQLYCCPALTCSNPITISCTSENNFYRCPGENRILYSRSSYQYCPPDTTTTCFYKYDGNCDNTRTYSSSVVPTCSETTYNGAELYDSIQECLGELDECSVDFECPSGESCENGNCVEEQDCADLGLTGDCVPGHTGCASDNSIHRCDYISSIDKYCYEIIENCDIGEKCEGESCVPESFCADLGESCNVDSDCCDNNFPEISCQNNVCTWDDIGASCSGQGGTVLADNWVCDGEIVEHDNPSFTCCVGESHYVEPKSQLGEVCSSDLDCYSYYCDKSHWYSLTSTCQPTPWHLLKKIGATREEISDMTVNDLLNIACLENNECLSRGDNFTAKCMPLSKLKEDGTLNVGVKSFFEKAQGVVAPAAGGAIAGGLAGAVLCVGSGIGLALAIPSTAGAATVATPAVVAICGATISGGAILGGVVGADIAISLSDKDPIVEELEEENDDVVGLCVSEKEGGGDWCSFASTLDFIPITKNKCTNGSIVLGVLAFLIIILIRR